MHSIFFIARFRGYHKIQTQKCPPISEPRESLTSVIQKLKCGGERATKCNFPRVRRDE